MQVNGNKRQLACGGPPRFLCSASTRGTMCLRTTLGKQVSRSMDAHNRRCGLAGPVDSSRGSTVRASKQHW